MKLPRFLPDNDVFHRLLAGLAANSLGAARGLAAFVAGDAADAGAAGDIARGKAKAKRIVSDITVQLCRSYITPFDREDIQGLSEQLYKATKTIEKVAERMRLHGLANRQDDFSPQTALIVAEAEAMAAVIADLARLGSGDHAAMVQRRIEAMHDLELKGDAVLGELLVALFDDADRATRDLILRKDIYDLLEKVIDRYRDTAAVALEIVLKHG